MDALLGFSMLASVLSWRDSDRIMIPAIAYVDESGDHYTDGPHRGKYRRLTLAGCVARCDEWKDFENAWARVLAGNYPKPVAMLHAKDLHRERGGKLYARWSQGDKNTFLNNFFRALELAPAMHFFGASIEIPDPNAPIADAYLKRVKDAVRRAMQQARGTPVHFVFAKNKAIEEDKLRQIMRYLKMIYRGSLGTSTFDGEPTQILPLQVADFAAYEIAHYIIGKTCRDFLRLKDKFSVWVPEIDVQNVRTLRL